MNQLQILKMRIMNLFMPSRRCDWKKWLGGGEIWCIFPPCTIICSRGMTYYYFTTTTIVNVRSSSIVWARLSDGILLLKAPNVNHIKNCHHEQVLVVCSTFFDVQDHYLLWKCGTYRSPPRIFLYSNSVLLLSFTWLCIGFGTAPLAWRKCDFERNEMSQKGMSFHPPGGGGGVIVNKPYQAFSRCRCARTLFYVRSPFGPFFSFPLYSSQSIGWNHKGKFCHFPDL